MTNKKEQTLIQKWIWIYKGESNSDLEAIYNDEFKNKPTPRRKEDKARKKAIEALLQ